MAIRSQLFKSLVLPGLIVLVSPMSFSWVAPGEAKVTKKMTPYQKAKSYFDAWQPEKAIKYFDEAIRREPNNAKYYRDRGRCFLEMEKFQKGLTDLNKALSINPHYKDALNSRGEYYLYKGEGEKALADFKHVLKLNPKDKMPHWKLSGAYVYLGKYDLAINELTSALRKDLENKTYRHRRAVLYETIGDFDKAIADYTKLISISPRDSYYFPRAENYIRLKKYSKAVSDYTSVIKLNPDDEMAYTRRADLNFLLGNCKQAVEDADKAIKCDSKSGAPYFIKAIASKKLGKSAIYNASMAKARKFGITDRTELNRHIRMKRPVGVIPAKP